MNYKSLPMMLLWLAVVGAIVLIASRLLSVSLGKATNK